MNEHRKRARGAAAGAAAAAAGAGDGQGGGGTGTAGAAHQGMSRGDLGGIGVWEAGDDLGVSPASAGLAKKVIGCRRVGVLGGRRY